MSELHTLLDNLLEIIVFHYTVVTHDTSYSVESLKDNNKEDFTQLETILSELINQSTPLDDKINRPVLMFVLETIQCLSLEIYTNAELSEESMEAMKDQLFYFFVTLNKLSNMREGSTFTHIYDKKIHGFKGEKLHGFLGDEAYSVLGNKIITQFNQILTLIDVASSDSVDGEELQPSHLKERISQFFTSYQTAIKPILLNSQNVQLQTNLEASKQEIELLKIENAALKTGPSKQPPVPTQTTLEAYRQEIERLRIENAALKTGPSEKPLVATQANPPVQSGRRHLYSSATAPAFFPNVLYYIKQAAAMASALAPTDEATTEEEITNPDSQSPADDEKRPSYV